MIEIAPRLFIAKESDIANLTPADYSLCSLAHTYHYQMHGWKKGENRKNDPCYVMCSHGNQILSVNWVDGQAHLYNWEGKGVENFQKILTWIEYQLDHNRQVIIMCNQGLSRSPTIALLYLAKVLARIPNQTFSKARTAFEKLYPDYAPKGIADFVATHWNEI